MAKKRGDGGSKHGDDVVMVTGTIRGNTTLGQTNQCDTKSSTWDFCLEHEPYCCQSKWCWPVGCKQKLGGLSLNHLRPEVE